MTPADRAAAALESAEVMCTLLAAARARKAPHTWEGSAFRRHPCGIVVETILFTHHWHVDNGCDISITDGPGWDRRRVCTDSFSQSGNPHPQPFEGASTVTVWQSGKWLKPEYLKLRGRVLAILTEAAQHVALAEAQESAREAAQRATAADRRQAAERRAIAMAVGSAA